MNLILVRHCTKKTGHDVAYDLLGKAWKQAMAGEMLTVLKTAQGKPYFAGNPLYFSLSHSKIMAVCAISDAPIGVDIEKLRPLEEKLPKRVLSHGELCWLQNQPETMACFFRLWTMKEAYVKFTGTGFDGAPKKVEICSEDGDFNHKNCHFKSWNVGACMLSVCTLKPCDASPILMP